VGAFDLSTDRLTAAIREAFPDLAFQDVQRIDGGEDHVVLLVDDELIFRFPRSPERQVLFAAELRVLAALEGRSGVPVPAYRWIAADTAFGGYRLLPGRELRRARFERLEGSAQRRILGQVADLLNALHALPHDLLADADGGLPAVWSAEDYAVRWRESRSALTAPHVDAGRLARFDRFYEAYARLASGIPRLRHGDLTDDHLLLADAEDSLAGVIDFADASIGDVAADFCFFWSFGAWAPRFLVERYAFIGDDPGILCRSLWRYARFQIEGLHRAPADQLDWMRAEIDGALDALGVV
jgi:aminoglycoside 2''-phosphotransferase